MIFSETLTQASLKSGKSPKNDEKDPFGTFGTFVHRDIEKTHTEDSEASRHHFQQGDYVHLVNGAREIISPDAVIILGVETRDDGQQIVRFIDPETGKVKYREAAKCELANPVENGDVPDAEETF